MAKVKVPVYGTVGKAAFFDPDANKGATIGADLKLPDGTIPSLAELAIALAAASSAVADPNADVTIWSQIQEIPANVVEVEELTGNGLVVRQSDGNWLVRDLVTDDGNFISITNGDGDAGNPSVDVDFSAAIDWTGQHRFDVVPTVLEGMSYESVVLETRQVIAGDGMAGGGALSGDVTLNVSLLGLEDLTDPGADRIAFWDDSAGAFAWLEVGSGLSLSGTTLSATGGGGSSNLAGLDDTAISGSQATGAVLYWDGTDWADTDAIDIDPAGDVELSGAGTLRISTAFHGARITGASDLPRLALYNNANSTEKGSVGFRASGNALEVRNLVHGGEVRLLSEDAGGTLQSLLIADPDAETEIYHAGLKAIDTRNVGANVYDSRAISGSAGKQPQLWLKWSDGTDALVLFNNAGTESQLRSEVAGASFSLVARNTADSAYNKLVDGDPDGPVGLYYGGTEELRTADSNATDYISGAEVKDYGGTWRQVGFIDAERRDVSSNTTVGRDDWGKTIRCLYGISTLTFNTEADVQASVMLTVIARNTGVTLTQGSGVTLRWFDGATANGQTGNRTLANGGVCTVFKFSDSEYYVWGAGLS